ncbi:MAG TPA: SpoIIE family protein phosphatase [Nitrospirales bacterium]
MQNEVTSSPPFLEWGVATQAFPGQATCGDRHVMQAFPRGALVAVIDGLGHGEEAAAAAEIAVATLRGHAREPVITLLNRCHEQLRTSRGVVMSMASFNAREGTLTWIGVGNVEGLLRRAGVSTNASDEALLLRPGILGIQLPPLSASIVPVMQGDTLIFVTDGITPGFVDKLNLRDPPQELADRILAQHGKSTDDALVLIARYGTRST